MLEFLLGLTLLISLTCYVLTGGADYGAGVLNLTTRGTRATQQSALIDRALAPIWEANHVWLILIVTILFTAFPRVFTLISTRLHIPITLLLIAIVLRGSAFAFRTSDVAYREHRQDGLQRLLRPIFTASSVIAPLMLGIILGAMASGRLALSTDSFMELFVSPWLAPFPILVGVMTLFMFVYLAAVYLVVEAESVALKQDFRLRAFVAWSLLTILTLVILVISRTEAPEVYTAMIHNGYGWTVLAIVGILGLAAGTMIRRHQDRLSRLLAAGYVIALMWGWAVVQYPYLVEPLFTFHDAAPSTTLQVLLITLLIGVIVVFPSLYVLYRLFKGRYL